MSGQSDGPTSGEGRWSSRRHLLFALLAATLGAAVVVSWFSARGPDDPTPDPAGASEAPATTLDAGDDRLAFEVDPSLVPAVAAAEGLEEGDPPRPVGRLQAPDGPASDLVLSELIVTASDRGLVEDLARRYGGEILDEFPAGEGEPVDYLVRIEPPEPDLQALAGRLGMLEPDVAGTFVASSADLLGLMAVAASETSDELEIGLNWVAKPSTIEESRTLEAPDLNVRNAFEWPYIASAASQAIGVDAAWRLLAGYGKLDNRVRILVVDGGFIPNPDFPDQTDIVRGDWGTEQPLGCGDNPCPWHGTHVALAAAAQLDNEYGTVGPAGPVAELYAFQQFVDFWKTMRRVKKAVADYGIDVVNMSFSWDVKAFKAASKKSTQRHLDDMKKAGAIVFASAGNDGADVDAAKCVGNQCWESTLTIPCETEAAICVGGMAWDSTLLDSGSNYGSLVGDESVDIYGPFCVFSINDPTKAYTDLSTTTVCGTSFASPFLAGVAALVKAADPSLTPDEVWAILRDTAWEGGLGPPSEVPGHQRRVNAAAAVAAALGVEIAPPQVTITQPGDGEQFTLNEFPQFAATATEFTGLPLPVTWRSDVDGPLNQEPTFDPIAGIGLSPGVHTITATATDLRGLEGSAEVKIEIVDQPPEVAISSPQPGSKVYQGALVGFHGETLDPDTSAPLPYGAVEWRVFDQSNDVLVFKQNGHTAGTDDLPPGSYRVEFRAAYGTLTVTATSEFIVLPVPPGESVPQVFIEEPKTSSYDSGNGNPVPIVFKGRAIDEQNGELSGSRLRWTATSEKGTEIVLCEGSNFPADPFSEPGDIGDIATPTTQPGLTVFKDCSEFTFELGLDPLSGPVTTWAIRLDAADYSGLVGTTTLAVQIRFVTG